MSVLTWVLVVGGVAFSVFMAWLLAPVEAALMRDRAAATRTTTDVSKTEAEL